MFNCSQLQLILIHTICGSCVLLSCWNTNSKEKYNMRFLWTSSQNIFINQPITLFSVRSCLRISYMVDTLRTELMANSSVQLMPEWILSSPFISSARNIAAFFTFRNTRYHFSATPGAILNRGINKGQKCKITWHWMNQKQETYLQHESWNERAERHLVPSQLSCSH